MTGRVPHPTDALERLRERVLELEQDVHRLVLSGEAANDDLLAGLTTGFTLVHQAVKRLGEACAAFAEAGARRAAARMREGVDRE